MTTLYRRATPSQYRILRVVEGAVRNAAHAHPNIEIPQSFARSVAKRATGTLTAQWAEVLAARSASSEASDVTGYDARSRVVSSQHAIQRGAVLPRRRRSPLMRLWQDIAKQMRALKTDDPARYAAYQDVLRMIAGLQAVAPSPRCEVEG